MFETTDTKRLKRLLKKLVKLFGLYEVIIQLDNVIQEIIEEKKEREIPPTEHINKLNQTSNRLKKCCIDKEESIKIAINADCFEVITELPVTIQGRYKTPYKKISGNKDKVFKFK